MLYVVFWALRLIGVIVGGLCAVKLCRSTADGVYFAIAMVAWSLVEFGTVYGRQLETKLVGHRQEYIEAPDLQSIPPAAPMQENDAAPMPPQEAAPRKPAKLIPNEPVKDARIQVLAAGAAEWARDKKKRGDRRALHEIIERSLEDSITRSSPWFKPALQEAKRIALVNEATAAADAHEEN